MLPFFRNHLAAKDKDYILYTIDNLLQNFKAKQAYAHEKSPDEPGFELLTVF